MSKRILAALLCMAMLLSLVVLPTYASVDEDITPTDMLCPCGCGQILENVNWIPWASNDSEELGSGHYYLERDYAQDGQKTIISGDRIVLDLRGHTLTTKDYSRLFLLYGYLAVMDTVGGGCFSSKTSNTTGGVITISTNESNDPTFELYSGTVMPDHDNQGSKRGGLIHLDETATFRMYGGRLMNGNVTTGYPGGLVAGITVNTRIEILGGELMGGKAGTNGGAIYNLGTTVLKNCRIVGCEAGKYGGNVCQNGGSLTIENSIIESGVSNATDNGGGNVCVIGTTTVSIKDSVIRNGYTASSGGNLCLGAVDATIENTRFEGGVAAKRGNNIYGGTNAKSLTIRDCQLPGDVTYLGKSLRLEGLVKIGLLNNGLKLWRDTTVATVDATGLTQGSEIYVDAKGEFAENADPAYFKGALRTVITESASGLTATQAASGELGGYCPHCGQRVVWNAFGTSAMLVQNCLFDSATDTDPKCNGLHLESGHYYMTADKENMSMYYVGVYLSGTKAVKDVVLDFAGYNATAFGRAFYIRPDDAAGNNNQLTLLDSVGGGSLQGSGSTSKQGGGVLYNDGGILNIYGGTYQYVLNSARVVFNGGVIYNSDTVNIYGGILDGSQYAVPETDPETTNTVSYYGGTLYQGDGKTLNVTAGRFVGGSAWGGGNLCLGASENIQITGGQFHGGTAVGTASDGGGANIRLRGASSSKKGVANFSNCSITGGNVAVAKSGGNLLALYYTVHLTNCYVANGIANDGGNVSISSSTTVNATDTIIVNGDATKRGGNVQLVTTSSRLNLDGSLLTYGSSGTSGGNINTAVGYVTIRGGELSYGVSRGSYGGNINATAGDNSATCDQNVRIAADEAGNIPLIAGGYAKTYGGNIYAGGVLYLEAAHIVSGSAGSAGDDLCLPKATNQGKLEIGSGVIGDISLYVSTSLLDAGIYGAPIGNTVCDTLNATIALEGSYDFPQLCAKNGVLYVGSVAVVDEKGDITWYTDTAAAVAACDENSYLKIYADENIVLTKNCAVDLNGKNANVSGAYTLFGMDSSGDAFAAPAGKVTVAAETTIASDHAAPNGKRYLHLDGSFHRIQVSITNVALRPSADGLYYTGVWSADETVAAQVSSYGIAVSVVNAPGADYATDSDTLYTTFTGSTLTNGEKKNGVLIRNILRADRSSELNSAYGQMPVFATAYLTFADGTVLLGSNVAMSLRDIMQTVDERIVADPQNYRRLTLPMREFYEKWKNNGMGSWELNKIPDPGDDGIMNILMIGNSFCSYYVQELWALGQAAGIEMRVCNVYYSGCNLTRHYRWWLTGEANYVFHTTTGPERVSITGRSLEWCLGQYEWDVISVQEGSGVFRVNNQPVAAEQAFANNKEAYDHLIPYLKSQFPKAEFYWHQTWAYQVGYKRDGDSYTVPDKATQDVSYGIQHDFAEIICREYGLKRVPSGEAWKIIRDNGYDQLCARLGRDFYGQTNGGDYYHDGDIGGGQYLNACVWFEVLTGQSCIGIGYEPTYVHNGVTYGLNEGITAAELQQAAHAAVEAMKAAN